MRWLRSLTRITYLSKLIGIHSLAVFLKLELFRVYIFRIILIAPSIYFHTLYWVNLDKIYFIFPNIIIIGTLVTLIN
ncbi:hypothetical protein PEC301879_05030 [Pectobacterium carotovorum subsp. carotovorum]|nr:hypothetical protein PEC301879_05030 [Pectobacterium carotovorum subsp. carotovorum]